MKRQVLVNGGTGVIGSAIVEELKRLDFDVTTRGGPNRKGNSRIQESWDADDPYGMVCAFGNYGPKGKFADTNPGMWLHSLIVNLHMQIAQVHAFANLLNGRPGRIVMMSGAGIGSSSHPTERTAYTTAKGALVTFCEAVASEIPSIAIVCVAPGSVKSNLNPQGTGNPDAAARMVGWLMTTPNVDDLSGRLLSAQHDDVKYLDENADILAENDYRLRRFVA